MGPQRFQIDQAHIVLSLYGALPLPADVNPQRNLGQIAGIELGGKRGSKTLVLADSPNKLTGMATLKKAIAQRDNLLGGWDRVVVLGWNFEPSIGETITALNDSRLEVLVIPPDFLVRTADAVYLVETKAQQQTMHPNVQRKLKAALAWCERITALTPEQRGGPPWHYVLLAENVVYEWQAKGARLAELLDYAKLRPLADASLQARLL